MQSKIRDFQIECQTFNLQTNFILEWEVLLYEILNNKDRIMQLHYIFHTNNTSHRSGAIL
jgi:hypothetical protein